MLVSWLAACCTSTFALAPWEPGVINRSGEFIHFRRITLFEKVAVTFTPFAVTLGKSIQAVLADAVSVPEGVDEIHPFLRTILAYRTVKAFANPGE